MEFPKQAKPWIKKYFSLFIWQNVCSFDRKSSKSQFIICLKISVKIAKPAPKQLVTHESFKIDAFTSLIDPHESSLYWTVKYQGKSLIGRPQLLWTRHMRLWMACAFFNQCQNWAAKCLNWKIYSWKVVYS